MTSEATRKADRDAVRKEEAARQAKETLKVAQREAEVFAEANKELLGHTPPLVREGEHAFVEVEESEFTAEELAPNLTGIGVAGLVVEPPATIEVKANDVTHQIPLTESRLEIMSDEDIADAGLLTDAPELIHPARIAPTSERQRTPYQRSPAAGPGTWPVPEDALPAVMPSDPPVEEGEDPGDATLTGYPPFKYDGRKVVVFSSAGVQSEVAPDETRNAAALYLRLRNQFPHFTEDQLADEFIIQWEARVGAKQSMRPSQELSQHGDTAVGDPRLTQVNLGEARKEATQAQPRSTPLEPSTANAPEAGLPSANEPATRYKDDEKFGLKLEEPIPQDKADLEAIALTKQYREVEEEAEAEAFRSIADASDENARREGAKGSGEKSPAQRPGPRPTQMPAQPPLSASTSDALKRAGESKPAPAPAKAPDKPKGR